MRLHFSDYRQNDARLPSLAFFRTFYAPNRQTWQKEEILLTRVIFLVTFSLHDMERASSGKINPSR